MSALDNQMQPQQARRSKDAVAGVHAAHCCWQHGCRYGAEDCPVTDPEVMLPQDHRCEVCDYEVREWWPLIVMAQRAYDAGRRAGQAEGTRHGFAEGSFRGFRQGRIYAETGRLEPFGDLPLVIGHEVTTEMVKAFGEGWEAADRSMGYLDPDSVVPGYRRRAGLEAVLAIVRRDATLGEGERL